MMIDWLPWQKETFEKARREGKPILLDISATWCHWCHVMEKGTYASDEVIKRIDANFVAVRVDTDERPDVNERYNQGGWPSTVFLTPKGEIITGTTYVPVSQMVDLLDQVVEIFQSLAARDLGLLGPNPTLRQESVNSVGRDHDEASFEEKRIHFIKYRDIFLRDFDHLIMSKFDPVYGGFNLSTGWGPKFPHLGILEYCLAKYQKENDSRFVQILTKSLEGMSEGALFDHLDGGFFRYTVDPAWQSPHFEKLLSDNVRLAKLYFDAYKLLGDRSLLETAQKTSDFIKNWLYRGDEGGFYASVAADEEYYGRASRIERLAYRQEKKKPSIDKTIYSNFNCLASYCLYSVGEKEMSAKSFQRILKENQSPSGLFYHFVKGVEGFWPNLFIDQIAVARLTGSSREVSGGEAVTAGAFWGVVLENFYDKEKGGFWDRRAISSQDFGLLKAPRKNLDENVEAIQIFRDLGQAEEAKRSLIEIFSLYSKPSLQTGSLAELLLQE